MSKSGFGQMYRRLSSKLLDLVVTPHVLGEVPTEPVSEATETEAKLTAKSGLLRLTKPLSKQCFSG